MAKKKVEHQLTDSPKSLPSFLVTREATTHLKDHAPDITHPPITQKQGEVSYHVSEGWSYENPRRR